MLLYFILLFLNKVNQLICFSGIYLIRNSKIYLLKRLSTCTNTNKIRNTKSKISIVNNFSNITSNGEFSSNGLLAENRSSGLGTLESESESLSLFFLFLMLLLISSPISIAVLTTKPLAKPADVATAVFLA